jgi:Family of unknown function (DUF5522)
MTDAASHGEAIVRAHEAAVAAGEPGYLDPETGDFVFTASSLLANGACCENGCRHCPWGYSPA